MSFDPASFIDATITGANSTVSTPVPAGEYIATAGDVEIRQWVGKKDPTKSGLVLDVPWIIEGNDVVTQATGRPKNIVRQSVMLDVTADGQGLDMGKGMNVSLGKLREAVGLNNPAAPFSFRMVTGRQAKITVGNRPEGDKVYADVNGVAKV